MNTNNGFSVALDANLSVRVMSAALSRLLRGGQSVVVELKDPRGIFAVQKSPEGQVVARPATPKEIETFTSYDKIMDAMQKNIVV